MKSCETLLKYCFWNNFISRKKLNKMTTKTGDKVKDDLNKLELYLLAEKIWKKVKKDKKITPYHFLTLLDGSNKLTWRKKRRLERMVMVYCMQVYDKKKCKKCGEKRIRIILNNKKYMKTIGKKVPIGDLWKVKIVKCGCGEYLEVKKIDNWMHCGNSYTKSFYYDDSSEEIIDRDEEADRIAEQIYNGEYIEEDGIEEVK